MASELNKDAQRFKNQYNALRDLFTAAKFYTKQSGKNVVFHVQNHVDRDIEIKADTDVSVAAETFMKDRYVQPNQYNNDLVVAIANAKADGDYPDIQTAEEAKIKFASALKDVNLYISAHTTFTKISIGDRDFTPDSDEKWPVERISEMADFMYPLTVQTAPIAPKETPELPKISDDVTEEINRSVARSVVRGTGTDTALILSSMKAVMHAMIRASKNEDDTSIRLWAYMIGEFKRHIEASNNAEFTGTEKQREALLKVLPLLSKASELDSYFKVRANQARITPEPSRNVLAKIHLECDRGAPVADKSTNRTPLNPVAEVIAGLDEGGWNVEAMCELHAYMLYQRLSEKLGEDFPYEGHLSDADWDVRLTLMKMYDLQKNLVKHLAAPSEEIANIYSGNKDIVLAAYLENHYCGAQDQPNLSDAERGDKGPLRNWIMGNAQCYLSNGLENAGFAKNDAHDLWKAYLRAKQITPEQESAAPRRTTILTRNRDDVMMPEQTRPAAKISGLPAGSVITDRAQVLAPGGIVEGADHRGKSLGGGAEHKSGHPHGRHAPGDASERHTLIISQNGLGYDNPFAAR